MEYVEDINKQVNGSIRKVLIADDDLPSRILLRAAITQWGYEAIEANDGEEAWQLLQDVNSPRLLILDWLMPKLDGITLCNRIKQDKNQRYYIIMLTQVTGSTNIVKGFEAGADEFLLKPFNMAELRSRLATGSRIIKYEALFAAQNRYLQKSILQMESLTNLALNLSINIDDLIKAGTANEEVKKTVNEMQKIIQMNIKLFREIENGEKAQIT